MAWSFRLPSCLPICPNSPLAASKGARARACFCLHARARARFGKLIGNWVSKDRFGAPPQKISRQFNEGSSTADFKRARQWSARSRALLFCSRALVLRALSRLVRERSQFTVTTRSSVVWIVLYNLYVTERISKISKVFGWICECYLKNCKSFKCLSEEVFFQVV